MKEKKTGRIGQKRRRVSLGDSGSTMITTLVVITFLMILASVILAVTTANLRMKQIEYAAKKNFYTDEQILDDIYNGIGKRASDCLAKAYAKVLSQVSVTGGAPGAPMALYENEDQAFEAFSKDFMDRLEVIYPTCTWVDPSSSSYPTSTYKKVLEDLNKYSLHSAGGARVERFDEVRIETEPAYAVGRPDVPARLIFEDMVVKYHPQDASGNPTGYEAAITTDIVVEVPYLTFFEGSSLLPDYALIGNKGIYFDGGAGTQEEVEGNVYAGIDTAAHALDAEMFGDIYGGLNFRDANVKYSGNYLISKGDVNLRRSQVIIEPQAGAGAAPGSGSQALPQVWAETVRTVDNELDRSAPAEPSSLAVNADLYVANDLELNAAESAVTLKGSYYGYNNGTYATKEKGVLEPQYADTGEPVKARHTTSSAVIINGNRSTLDLSGLNTFVASGLAYVDFHSPYYPSGDINGKFQEYATGESLALKTNQYLYLAPSECLTRTNPVTTAEVPAVLDDVWEAQADWFGLSYVNAVSPVTAKTYSNGTDSYTYFYLNFDAGKQKEYASLVLNMVDPAVMTPEHRSKYHYDLFTEPQLDQIWKLKQEIQSKAIGDAVRSVITVADETKAGIYTGGLVSRVSGPPDSALSAPAFAPESALPMDYITKVQNNLGKHYQWLYYELNPKEQFSLTSDSLTTKSDWAAKEYELPVSQYVKVADLINNGGTGTEYKCGNYHTLLSNGNRQIDGEFKGIVLCAGDVTIKSGAHVEGLVIAGGRIFVEGSGSIRANRAIVQAILDEEQANDPAGTNNHYARFYLRDYKDKGSLKDYSHRATGTEYTDYISYRNWRKGEA